MLLLEHDYLSSPSLHMRFLQVLRAMGAYAAHSAKGVGVAQGSLAACMIEAGISPLDDIFLLSMCQAFRTFALKGVEVGATLSPRAMHNCLNTRQLNRNQSHKTCTRSTLLPSLLAREHMKLSQCNYQPIARSHSVSNDSYAMAASTA